MENREVVRFSEPAAPQYKSGCCQSLKWKDFACLWLIFQAAGKASDSIKLNRTNDQWSNISTFISQLLPKLQSLLFQWDNSLLGWHSFAFPFILLEFYLHFRVSDLPAQFALSSTPLITLSPTLPCSSPPSVSFFWFWASLTHPPPPFPSSPISSLMRPRCPAALEDHCTSKPPRSPSLPCLGLGPIRQAL